MGRFCCTKVSSRALNGLWRKRRTLEQNELRFARVSVDVEGSGLSVAGIGAAGQLRDSLAGARLTRIGNVGDGQGVQGIFVAGPNPLWLIVRRSRVLALPTRGEGEIVAFTVFHNVNCPHGFILGTALGGVRICQMPSKNVPRPPRGR